MRLTLVGVDPDSNPTGSPTVYRTNRDSWLVQGWVVTDPEALAQMNIPEGETAVEIPDRIIHFFTRGVRRESRTRNSRSCLPAFNTRLCIWRRVTRMGRR